MLTFTQTTTEGRVGELPDTGMAHSCIFVDHATTILLTSFLKPLLGVSTLHGL